MFDDKQKSKKDIKVMMPSILLLKM